MGSPVVVRGYGERKVRHVASFPIRGISIFRREKRSGLKTIPKKSPSKIETGVKTE
jgi:hypothetical protein